MLRLLSDIQKFEQDLLIKVFFVLYSLASLHFLNKISVNDEIMNFIVKDFIIRDFMTMKFLTMKSLTMKFLTIKSLITKSLTTKFLSILSVKDKATISVAVILSVLVSASCNRTFMTSHVKHLSLSENLQLVIKQSASDKLNWLLMYLVIVYIEMLILLL